MPEQFVSTATKLRPKEFSTLVGQNFVSSAIKGMIESGNIAHAFLFSGHRGVGKTTSARLLARALNCEKGPTFKPCGKCESCRAIEDGSSLDVIEIDGASNTSVDDVRQIKEAISFPPLTSRYKIYIIDEVHMLSNSAFNALLKTIEEPPEWAVFIFATTELQKVPATIRSRCQQFSFRSLDVAVLANLVKGAAEKSGAQITEDAALWIAKEANGSARDAYTVFDQLSSALGGNITSEGIAQQLGGLDSSQVAKLVLAALKGENQYSELEELLTSSSANEFLKESVYFLRTVMLRQCGINSREVLMDANVSLADEAAKLISPAGLEWAITGALEAIEKSKNSPYSSLRAQLFVSRLNKAKNYRPPEVLAQELSALKEELKQALLSGGLVISETQEPSPVSQPAPLKREPTTVQQAAAEPGVNVAPGSAKGNTDTPAQNQEVGRQQPGQSSGPSRNAELFMALGGTLVDED